MDCRIKDFDSCENEKKLLLPWNEQKMMKKDKF